MRAIILPSKKPETCYPLSCTRTIGELPAGNRPLAELQSEQLRSAGFNLAEAPGASAASSALFLCGDAWISEKDCIHLLECSAATILADCSGRALAWIGPGATPPGQAERIPSAQGFRITYPWDLLHLNEIVVGGLEADAIRGDVHPATQVEGCLQVGEGTRILPGVFIEGNVVIGRNCKIGPNCYLRGNTSIGHNCHVGQAVELKNSILMDGVSVGHLSYCGDTIIAENANLGAGTITANLRHDGADHRSMVAGQLLGTGRRKLGAVIGAGVHTGIQTSLYPGRKLWPGVSTRPGEIVQNDILR